MHLIVPYLSIYILNDVIPTYCLLSLYNYLLPVYVNLKVAWAGKRSQDPSINCNCSRYLLPVSAYSLEL
jgi:hypothetical protein